MHPDKRGYLAGFRVPNPGNTGEPDAEERGVSESDVALPFTAVFAIGRTGDLRAG